MSWYDDLSDETIEELQINMIPLGLRGYEFRKILGKIPTKELQEFRSGEWRDLTPECALLAMDHAYRVKPDWQRPKPTPTKPKYTMEQIALIERLKPHWNKPDPEKQGHWEEFDIHTEGHACGLREYCFHINGSCLGLSRAFSIVGFGGIQFEGVDGFYNMIALNGDGPDDGPSRPLKIRFWVEG